MDLGTLSYNFKTEVVLCVYQAEVVVWRSEEELHKTIKNHDGKVSQQNWKAEDGGALPL